MKNQILMAIALPLSMNVFSQSNFKFNVGIRNDVYKPKMFEKALGINSGTNYILHRDIDASPELVLFSEIEKKIDDKKSWVARISVPITNRYNRVVASYVSPITVQGQPVTVLSGEFMHSISFVGHLAVDYQFILTQKQCANPCSGARNFRNYFSAAVGAGVGIFTGDKHSNDFSLFSYGTEVTDPTVKQKAFSEMIEVNKPIYYLDRQIFNPNVNLGLNYHIVNKNSGKEQLVLVLGFQKFVSIYAKQYHLSSVTNEYQYFEPLLGTERPGVVSIGIKKPLNMDVARFVKNIRKK